MRVVICGAGQVGYNIAAYLARENNDVTIIDIDGELIESISNELDVNGIKGHASKPDIINMAGASEADLFIAVTSSDEVNMVACQVAHSLFNVPKKIARIRDQSYLDPAWFNLFSRSQMPIDVIISPETSVAEAILRRILNPGTTNLIPMADDKVLLVGIKCEEDCPLINTHLGQVKNLFSDLCFKVMAIFREDEFVIPTNDEQMYKDDEVYVVLDKVHLRRVLSAFGHEEKAGSKILIFGGGNVGRSLIGLFGDELSKYNITLIENDRRNAVRLSEDYDDIIVINGDCMNLDILKEADIGVTDTVVAITNDDEANILSSMIAKKMGCDRVVTLVNKNTFTPIISGLDIDAIVSPRSITVSSIIQHVRRGRIKSVHNIKDGGAEVIEIEVSDSCDVINKKVAELDLPQSIVIGSVVRNGEVIIVDDDTEFRAGDHVVVLAWQHEASIIEKLFSMRVELF